LFRLWATLGERVVRFMLNALVGSALAFVMVGPIALSPEGLALFLLALPLAFVLDFMAHLTIGLCAFWLENTSGLVLIYSRVTMILGGVLLPIELYPDSVQWLLVNLPFASIAYAPARMFVDPHATELVNVLARQGVGIALYAGIAAAIYA